VSWDSTPRRGDRGTIMFNTQAERFEAGLRELVRGASATPEDALVFINVWNEWAEGNYLETDLVRGRERLESVRRVSREQAAREAPRRPAPAQGGAGMRYERGIRRWRQAR
jgi:hypothetical protein